MDCNSKLIDDAEYRVYVDLDDVLVNFVGSMCDWLSVKNPYENDGYSGFDFVAEAGRRENRPGLVEEFHAVMDVPAFWIGLQLSDEGKAMLHLLRDVFKFDFVVITRAMSRNAVIGKSHWLRDQGFDNYCIVKSAPKCVGQGVLIDDNPMEQPHIMYPQPWNMNRYVMNKVGYVCEQLQYLSQSFKFKRKEPDAL